MPRLDDTPVARTKNAHRVGFAVRDARGYGAAFELGAAARAVDRRRPALVFGRRSPVRLEGEGILPAHFVVLSTEEGFVVATADERSPAMLNGQPMPASWTTLEIPSRVRAGTALVDFFCIRESGATLVDEDVEATVCETRRTAAIAPSPVASPLPPAVTLAAAPRRPPDPAARGPVAYVAYRARAAQLWAVTPPSSRILLALVAVLLLIVVVR